MPYDVPWAAAIGDDRGNPGSGGFPHHVAVGVGPGREGNDIHVGVGSSQFFAMKHAEEPSPPEIAAEPPRFHSVADDVNAAIEKSFGLQSVLQSLQSAKVLFRTEKSNVSEYSDSAPTLALGETPLL